MDYPDSKSKTQKFIVDTPYKKFQIEVDSCIDENNTYTKLGYNTREDKPFRLNRQVLISNNGTKALKNPWVETNQAGDWRNIEKIVSCINKKYSPVNNKEKILSVWRFFCENLTDARGGVASSPDPVIVLNSIGCIGCYHLALIMLAVYERMGFDKTRLVKLGVYDHWLPEVWYDDKYHMADACLYAFFPDVNGGVAGIDDLQKNYELTENIVHHNGPAGCDIEDRPYALDYYKNLIQNDEINVLPQPSPLSISMDYTLKPGESLVRHWNPAEKYAKVDIRSEDANLTRKPCYSYLLYEPDFHRSSLTENIDMHRNISFSKEQNMLTPVADNIRSEVVFKITSPYIVNGSTLDMEIVNDGENNDFGIDVLVDDLKWTQLGLKKWEQLYSISQDKTSRNCKIDLDEYVQSKGGKLVFSYYIRIWMLRTDGAVGFKNLKLKTYLQCATLSLPSLVSGNNVIEYSDDSGEFERNVEIVFDWQENTTASVPQSPKINSPGADQQLSLDLPEFNWQDDSPDTIDYHIQVSEYEDFKWPISPNFDRYISRTKYAGQTKWTPLRTFELTLSNKYFWRIRSKNNQAIWSQWSKPTIFSVK